MMATPAVLTFADVCRFEFQQNDLGNPPGKLCDCDLVWTTPPFEGMRLVGFAIWADSEGNAANVTFPARTYKVNGVRRSFTLLRGTRGWEETKALTEAIQSSYATYISRLGGGA